MPAAAPAPARGVAIVGGGVSGLATASVLADLVLPDDAGSPTRLGELWAEGPVLLAFLRHYG